MWLFLTSYRRVKCTGALQPHTGRGQATWSQNADTWYSKYIKNYKTNEYETLGQNWVPDSLFWDATLCRHNKSQMSDGGHLENLNIAICSEKIVLYFDEFRYTIIDFELSDKYVTLKLN